jgi:acyl carrier protein
MEKKLIEVGLQEIFKEIPAPFPLPTQHDVVIELDSLEHVELCVYVERFFKISITNEELELLSTLNNWIELIHKKTTNHQ